MIALQDRQRAVVEQLYPVVGRVEKLNVHRQPLLQVQVSQSHRLELVADQNVLFAATGWALSNIPIAISLGELPCRARSLGREF